MKPHLPKFLLCALLTACMCSTAMANNTVTIISDGTTNATEGLMGGTISVQVQKNESSVDGKILYAVQKAITDQDDTTATPETSDVEISVTSGGFSSWTAAMSNDDTTVTNHKGDITMTFQDDYKGAPTAFGVVKSGTVDGNVSLVFNAKNAEFSSFTAGNESDTNKNGIYASSVVGAYSGSITGTFSIEINEGTFGKKYTETQAKGSSIIGGIHNAGDSGHSIGATSIAINGGTILGDIYAGGHKGTIEGNTSIVITNLDAISSHTGDNIISAGGFIHSDGTTHDTINGSSTVTFRNVDGSYKGTVSGGSNVENASLLLDDARVSLGAIEDFNTITLTNNSTLIQGKNKLVFTGNISTDADSALGWTITKDSDNELSIVSLGTPLTENGWGGEVQIKGLTDGTINGGNGTLNVVINSARGTYDIASDTATVAGVYHLAQGAANIGNHGKAVPAEMDALDGAFAWYINKGTTLYIHEDTDMYSIGETLKHVYGEGDVILRAASGQPDDYRFELSISGKTTSEGRLITAPDYAQGYSEPKGVDIRLGNSDTSADISSYSDFIAYYDTIVRVDGKLEASEGRGHFNNVSVEGGKLQILLNEQDYHLAGTTSAKYVSESGSESGQTAELVIGRNSTDATVCVTLDALTGSDLRDEDIGNWKREYINLGYASGENFAEEGSFSINVRSINTKAYIMINNFYNDISANFNIEKGNKFWQKQYVKGTSNKRYDASLTLTGEGTYVLDVNSGIEANFGLVSRECDEITNEYAWRGIVEVNQLVAGNGIDYAYYGNKQSGVSFCGFKGDVVKWSESGTVDTDQPESVEIVSALKLTNTDSMSAYEVTGGIAKQNYTGSISGEGDFVVSATDNMDVTLSGDISEWEGNLKATAGEQTVTLSGAATTVNAVVAAEGGKLALTVDNSGKTTTFNKEVKVTSLTVNNGSIAKLTQESTVGTVKLTGAALELSDGISITENTLRSGRIANGSITSTATNDTVELDGISASNLRLYGEKVTFHSDEADVFFMAEEVVGSHTEVSFSSDIFSGMTLADGEALASLSVSNTIGGVGVTDLERTNVTIFLEGFTMETLADSWGNWDWKNTALSIDPSEATTYSGGVTVQDLLKADYASVTYSQTASGLTIRMQNIPEPTTATLSLLALAGLAARRRRK